ncbi:LysR family transcriptional regulator [Pseudonocardia broussonetiae]|uniref:LysR family transcriptional regulator n=1 Tax=Pseudonocardia broussonetiae TaxID=2736640 RepID=A0A6M6JL52_9PSEU|nr:LysR family transcriptional regulator [Pseudonocardia broussonetiae]QJY48015.1 LysR family transcriptional regulator [Pseudonocardia broussonetiae]
MSIASPESRVPLRYDNRITLQKLEVLCSVVELGGVSRAAEHLWVAQSVVSGHLRSLQERLGVRMLYRDGQKMKLTPAGEQVYRWACTTLAETRELMRHLDELNTVENERILLATSQTVGSYLLPPVLAEFGRERPGAVISMNVSEPEAAFDAVASGECDLGIVIAGTEYDHPHVRSTEIGREEITLVAGTDSLPGIDGLALADLRSIPVVAPAAGARARDAIDRYLVELGAAPQNVTMELGHPEAMKRVIRRGAAACLLFRACVQDELADGSLREIPILDADLTLPVLSIVRADRQLSARSTQLVERTRVYLAAR